MSIFLNSENQLRAGWKFAAYIVFLLLLWVATALALTGIVASRAGSLLENDLFVLALNQVAEAVAAVGAMVLAVRFVDHRPFRTFGIGFLPRWKKEFLWGLGLAAGMLALMLGGCYAFGYVSMHWTGNKAPVHILLSTLGILMVAAANEELVFRGFPLQILIDGVGEWPAMIGLSALFGAMHLSNPNASLLGTLNTILAGILLSLAYVRTRSLWMPYAIHVGWNVGLGFVFGFPLSGIDLASLWTTGIAGSDTILGGAYGPEGGLLATFIFATAGLLVYRRVNGPINSTKARIGRDIGRHDRDRAGNPR